MGLAATVLPWQEVVRRARSGLGGPSRTQTTGPEYLVRTIMLGAVAPDRPGVATGARNHAVRRGADPCPRGRGASRPHSLGGTWGGTTTPMRLDEDAPRSFIVLLSDHTTAVVTCWGNWNYLPDIVPITRGNPSGRALDVPGRTPRTPCSSGRQPLRPRRQPTPLAIRESPPSIPPGSTSNGPSG
jgi:hypothetical protein